jgi:predicted dehydrogenase
VDLVRWFLGEEIATVAASVRSDDSEHDAARVELTTEGGVEVQSWFSFRTGLADYLEFLGERGTLRVDRHSPRLLLRVPRRLGYGLRRRWVPPTADVAAWRLVRWTRPSVDPSYRSALQAFVDHVRGGPSAPASLEDGVRSLAAVLSAESTAVACASS